MAKQKYVKHDLVNLLQGMQNVENLRGLKFASVISKNQALITDALKDIEEVARPSEEFLQLSRDMQQYDMEKDRQLVEAKELENKELIDSRNDQMKNVDELLKSEAELSLFKISEKNLPTEISGKEMAGIQLLIK